MNRDDYERLATLSDQELFDFVTEQDSSQRRWVAMHLLEVRRNKSIASSAKWSAVAAWIGAAVAGISAFLAYLSSLK
ncbi:hypothetical protein PTW32_02675 [Dechloromonas agitata]|uniref:hypothetical protein n=1 Tax=Dechloromonas agitata TaxID=73030 RepID=UPI00237EC123|nr:hypothetical protein [Dechloromonas agitata]MDE1544309.1 hypothetical protein [Dechloromonas agitata]